MGRQARKGDEGDRSTRLRLESFLADVAVRFLRTPSAEVGGEIDCALAGLADILDVDRCGLALFSPGLEQLNVEHSFARPGVPTLLHEDLARVLPWYTRQLREGRRVQIDAAGDLPPQAKDESLYVQTTGLRSHVGLPLLGSAGPLGVLGVAGFKAERRWSADFLARLELLASAFAYVLSRRRAEERIEAAEDLSRSVLASLSSELLVLDGDGRVMTMNDAVRHSPRRTLFLVSEGTDYPAALAAAAETGFPEASRLAEGIQSVVEGRAGRFDASYSFPSDARPHYLLQVTPLEGRGGAVVAHIDVSDMERRRVELEKGLRETEQQNERLLAEVVVLQREASHAHGFDTIVGRSGSLRRVLDAIEQVAPTESPVLLLGETGTGKELVAQEVHRRSRRRERPFVTVNCAALPASLIESELFGHERGAFTGAERRTAGRFEVADGGTLFLDEIGELPPSVQAKLLRVLQSGELERLGSSRTIRTDVRLVAATNRDLPQAMREGHFRQDLYYRLGVFPIRLPPLRERREDIPLLVWHFIAGKRERLGRSVGAVPQRVMEAFCAHAWPGNVRELENVVERALILSDGETLAADPVLLAELGTADTRA
ncbi:MAG TPA: sigma 54-interacting transcriptional regulator [Vicinamibacteria bacterium]|nr:sigma 54-interacting transcriptional regulator [Vicinamibacteria bacterium]